MTLTPGLRNAALTAPVTSSVGWLGAVAGFLALAVAGLASQDALMEHAVSLAAEPITWFVITPLALAALFTGLVMSLGTPSGLFRHSWVLVTRRLTVLATVVLQSTQTASSFAGRAAATDSADRGGRRSYRLHAGVGLLVLLVTTTLSVSKPLGTSPYGRRTPRQERARLTQWASAASRPDVSSPALAARGPEVSRGR